MIDKLAELGFNLPSLVAQLVNFIVLFALLYLFAYKPILKMLDERSRRIKESMEQTELIKEQAAHAEEESRKRIQEATREGQELIGKAGRTAEELRRETQEQAKKEAEAFLNRARTRIQQERDEAIGEIREEFADLTIQAAEKVIERSLDKEAHLDLINKVLEESKTLGKG